MYIVYSYYNDLYMCTRDKHISACDPLPYYAILMMFYLLNGSTADVGLLQTCMLNDLQPTHTQSTNQHHYFVQDLYFSMKHCSVYIAIQTGRENTAITLSALVLLFTQEIDTILLTRYQIQLLYFLVQKSYIQLGGIYTVE